MGLAHRSRRPPWAERPGQPRAPGPSSEGQRGTTGHRRPPGPPLQGPFPAPHLPGRGGAGKPGKGSSSSRPGKRGGGRAGPPLGGRRRWSGVRGAPPAASLSQGRGAPAANEAGEQPQSPAQSCARPPGPGRSCAPLGGSSAPSAALASELPGGGGFIHSRPAEPGRCRAASERAPRRRCWVARGVEAATRAAIGSAGHGEGKGTPPGAHPARSEGWSTFPPKSGCPYRKERRGGGTHTMGTSVHGVERGVSLPTPST